MRRQFGAVAVLSAAAAVISLAGCGSSSTNPNSSTSFKSLPQAEQTEFENAAVEEVTADISTFTSLNPDAGLLFFNRVVPHRINGVYRMMHSQRNTPRFQTNGCSSTTGDPSDPDNDGVVNSSITTETNCTLTEGGVTSTSNGLFAYGDPTPNTQDLDVSDTANVSFSETGSTDGDLSLSLIGGSHVSEGTGVINLTGDWNLDATVTNGQDNGTFKLGANETATYSFSGTAPVTFGTLPEPGQFSVQGNWTYAINAGSANYNFSFSVSTPTALTIDGCSGNPSGIDSGEVDIKFTDGTLVAIKWSGCPSSPSVTVS